EAVPERGNAAPAAVDEADAVRPRHALAEVEDAVPPGTDAGHERRPRRKRRRRDRRAERPPAPPRHQRAEVRQAARRDPGTHEVEGRAVETDDEERRAQRDLSSRSRAPGAA